MEQRILKEVEALSDDLLDFACRLVAEPSTLGKEASAAWVMEEELTRLSFSPIRVLMEIEDLARHPGFAPVPWGHEGRYNVVATREPVGSGGRSALFNAHLDVVSAEPVDLWETDPFRPSVRDGWLHGRGAGDMKSGLAAMVYAVHAVERSGLGFRAPVTVQGVIEEECSGNGALACVLAGYDAEAVLIPEPFGPTILTDQVGVLWFKVTVRGTPSHVQAAGAGVNAIEKSFPLVAALRRLEAELNHEAVPPAYANLDHPLHLNIGMFHGGDWPSTVPAASEFHGRLSFFPGVPYEAVRQKVTDAVRLASSEDPWLAKNPPQVEFYGFRSDGHSVPRDVPVLATLNACHRLLTGEDARTYVSTCTTDLRAFYFFGKGQATCYGPVAENIHAANERVNLDSVIQVAKAYALFLARWCGLRE